EPVGDAMVAGHVEVEVAELTRREVPDRGALTVLGLVGDGEPLVAGNRRPGGGDHRRGAVAAFRGDGPAPRLHDPERGVHQVAMLGVLDRQERSVGRQPGEVAPMLIAGEAQPLRRVRDRAHPLAVDRGVDPERAVLGADARGHDAVALGEAAVPAARYTVEEWLRAAALERLREPRAGLVARVLLPEGDLGTVGREGTLAHAD